ncbi:hypothetical protein [Dyella sp.]|nr:hypothetical protein [Dyella sp.]MDR3447513.1 hypothetical protein [Dyella sp.]
MSKAVKGTSRALAQGYLATMLAVALGLPGALMGQHDQRAD